MDTNDIALDPVADIYRKAHARVLREYGERCVDLWSVAHKLIVLCERAGTVRDGVNVVERLENIAADVAKIDAELRAIEAGWFK